MSPFEELGREFKLRPEPGESHDAFAVRAALRVNKCSDPEWERLSNDLQRWTNKALEARDTHAAIPELVGFRATAVAEETAADAGGGEPPAAESAAEDTAEAEDGANATPYAKGKSKRAPSKTRSVVKQKPAKEAKVSSGGRDAPRGWGAAYPLNAKIVVLVKQNPHRDGTARAARWPKYRTGMTVKEALSAGFSSTDLRHGVRDKHIKVG